METTTLPTRSRRPATMAGRLVGSADIVLDFELGILNGAAEYEAKSGRLPAIASEPKYSWRAQALEADADRLLGDILLEYTAGATLFRTKGYFRGVGAPGYVVRILASNDPALRTTLPTLDEVQDIAKAIAYRVKESLVQWDVWIVFTAPSGRKTLVQAANMSEQDFKAADVAARAALARL